MLESIQASVVDAADFVEETEGLTPADLASAVQRAASDAFGAPDMASRIPGLMRPPSAGHPGNGPDDLGGRAGSFPPRSGSLPTHLSSADAHERHPCADAQTPEPAS